MEGVSFLRPMLDVEAGRVLQLDSKKNQTMKSPFGSALPIFMRSEADGALPYAP